LGVDVVFDPVGDITEQVLRSTKWNGGFVIDSREIPSIPLNLTLLKGNPLSGLLGQVHQEEPEGTLRTSPRSWTGRRRETGAADQKRYGPTMVPERCSGLPIESHRKGGGHTMIDFVVIGGGFAGISAAAHLAAHASVALFEMETSLAYHTSGRSAAMLVENYGSAGARPLVKAARPFLESPPPGSVEAPLLSPRPVMWVAGRNGLASLKEKEAVGLANGA
jgi:hypothetical protein